TQPIRVKWVFTKKMNAQGETERYKARLVAKGYKQKAGIDYDQVFAPITRIETSRLFIAQATQFKWPIYQMDVKSAFLNGLLEEDVYVEQPPGYMKAGNEKKVLKLKKALYGLKQAPRAWNTRIDTYFKENGFKQCPYEHALYVKKNEEAYAKEILKKSKMVDCNPVSTLMEPGTKLSKFNGGKKVNESMYRSLVRSLCYLTCTRPDISFSVGTVSQFMEDPVYSHWKALKRIL
ncbi:retrovirus-related pol polyprotein from transposon TNT 1-94, partial [Tanacetum coccineum]